MNSEDPRPGCVRRLIGGLGTLCALGAAAVFLLGEAARLASAEREGLFAEFVALGELAAQVRYPFGEIVAAGTVVLLLLRRWKSAALAALVTNFCLAPELRLSFQDRDPVTSGETLRLVSANLLRDNDLYAEALDAVLAEDPDVIGLMEISPAWREAALERLAGAYPHVIEGKTTAEWDETSWGSMLFSRVPFRSAEAVPIVVRSWPQRPPLEAVLETTQGPLTVHLLHPELPGRAYRLRARMAQLDWLAEREVQGERLLVGDLNTTSTSPLFGRLLERTGLRDSRAGFGRQPTWNQIPGQVPAPLASVVRRVWVPGFAIDHALASPGLDVVDRRTIEVPGSDHRAVVIEVGYPAASGPD